jgi:lipoprotein-releasing system ATP-binding protein
MSEKIALSLRNISKSYRQANSIVQVLDNINLDLYVGEMLAITGASGRGKSTLLHIAALLDAPDSGVVDIEGVAKYDKSLRSSSAIRLSKMGFIYQYHHLLGDFTAHENVAMPLLISGIRKEQAMEEACEMLKTVGLGYRLGNLPGEMSGGEQQRVAIARALINNPVIILADEPTGNLDPKTAQEIFALFLERARSKSAAVMMVTHNLHLAEQMDRIFEL